MTVSTGSTRRIRAWLARAKVALEAATTPAAIDAVLADGDRLRADVAAEGRAAGAARRRRRTEETYASSDEEASQLLVAFLESARNRRVPSIAEDDGGWGDASGSDADAS